MYYYRVYGYLFLVPKIRETLLCSALLVVWSGLDRLVYYNFYYFWPNNPQGYQQAISCLDSHPLGLKFTVQFSVHPPAVWPAQ